jgi:multidrug efflux pump subunit AcrA (membrane-fusion protein)
VSEFPPNREALAGPAGGPASRNGPGSLSERVQSLRLAQRAAAPTTWRSYLPWVLCAVFAACTTFLALGEPPAREAQPGDADPAAPPAESAAAPRPGAGPRVPPGKMVLRLKGNIVAIHQIQVSPKVSGMVEKLTFKEGDLKKKGDVLAVLEKVEYQSDYEHAVGAEVSARGKLEMLRRFRKEEAEQAKAELDEADVQARQLRFAWDRSKRLQGSAQAVEAVEQAESAFGAMAARRARLRLAWKFLSDRGPRDEQIRAAEADLKAAVADRVKAKWRLDNCVVTAPITGTILTKKTEEGSIVNSAAFNIAAMICEMADLAELEVDLAVPERDIAKVFRPQRAEVRTVLPFSSVLGLRVLGPEWDRPRQVWTRQLCKVVPEGYPDRPYEGYVSRVMPMADRGKGAVPVRVKIRVPREEAGMYLRPDMGAMVYFLNARVETEE